MDEPISAVGRTAGSGVGTVVGAAVGVVVIAVIADLSRVEDPVSAIFKHAGSVAAVVSKAVSVVAAFMTGPDYTVSADRRTAAAGGAVRACVAYVEVCVIAQFVSGP
jgi:hypothetical protein